MGKFEEITNDYKDLFFHVSHESYPTMHSHNGYWEFMFQKDGHITHKINGQTIDVPEKTLTLLRPDDVHSITSNNNNSRIMLGVRSNYFMNFINSAIPDFYDKLKNMTSVPSVVVSDEKASEIIKTENSLLLANEETRYKTLQQLFFIFTQEILFADLKTTVNSFRYSKTVNLLLQLISIPKNLALPMPELIEKTKYSYSNVNKIFLKEVGITLNKYLKEKRIDHAKNLLVNTDIPLQEIAYSVGYNNYSNFSLFFKTQTQKTPAEYRKTYSKNF